MEVIIAQTLYSNKNKKNNKKNKAIHDFASCLFQTLAVYLVHTGVQLPWPSLESHK